MRSVRPLRRFTVIAATIVALFVGMLIVASPASASESWQVNPTRACQQQYGGGVFGASLYKWSPDGIYCYGLSFPLGLSWVGTLDRGRINNYCKAAYRNSRAVIGTGWRNPLNAWWCRRG